MREEDLLLLITLDDPWNAQECDIFNNHPAVHTVTYLPGRPYPTTGRHDRRAEDIFDTDSYRLTSNTSAGKGNHHARC